MPTLPIATPALKQPPSRLERARLRAAAVRRGVVIGAVGCFGALLVLVRTAHPAAAARSAGLAAPSSLVAEIQSPQLGGGSIAAAGGQPTVATSTS